MKALFVVFHGFSAHSGISKKIFDQCEALRRCGVEAQLCYIRIDADGRQRRMIGDGSAADAAAEDFGRGLRAKLAKRMRYGGVTRYIREQGIDFLYVRYDHNANPALVGWFARVRRLGVRIALEIPTYPYDREFTSRKGRLKLAVERLFRRPLMRYVDRIVTFSDHAEIFGRPAIGISNGIDFGRIPLKRRVNDTSERLRLLGVANIHFWHGFDRVIEGLGRWYAAPHGRSVDFHIVGDGSPALMAELRAAAERCGVAEHVTIHGPLAGEALDALFEACDFGVASLGRHRSGIERLKTLKNREYAARGIPFVYSECDADFDGMPYVLKAPADDSPLDIEALVRFADSVAISPAAIRATIEGELSWENQMRTVVRGLYNDQNLQL